MIQAEQLTKSFGRVRVLDQLDLAVASGERVALVGANGAGKTTLIRCLLGEYTYAGKLAVSGCEPRAARTDVLRRIGFVPQLPPPLRMPVGRLLGFAATVCGGATQPMEAVSQRLGLDPHARVEAAVRQALGRSEAEAADRDRARSRLRGARDGRAGCEPRSAGAPRLLRTARRAPGRARRC